jgi:hypothetical protein
MRRAGTQALRFLATGLIIFWGGHTRAGLIFGDDFNRPNGTVGNGWSSFWGSNLGNPNVSLVNGEVSAAGYPNLAGGIFRTMAITFPVTFSFDFHTSSQFGAGGFGPFNDGGWYIGFNVNTSSAGSPFASFAQVSFSQVAGSRNVLRSYFNGTNKVFDSSPSLPEPIPGQRDFNFATLAHIEGLVNPDLSGTITVHYNDGHTPDPVTFAFGAASGPLGAPPGSTLVLGNTNATYGPDYFDNLVIATPQASPVPEPGTLVSSLIGGVLMFGGIACRRGCSRRPAEAM